VTTTGADGDIGIGSGVNFLAETVVRARNGVELSRSQTHHLQQTQANAVRQDANYASTLGWVERGNALQAGTQYLIPLCDVSPFFTQSSLIPSMLGTMRLEISWAPLATVFSAVGPTAYNVSDVAVVCKAYDLSDGVLRRLTQIAASTALTMAWVDISRTVSRAAGTSMNVNCVKTASRALGVMACVQPPNYLTNNAADSFQLSDYNENVQYQWQLGSSMVTTEPIIGSREAQVHALHAFGMWGRGQDGFSNRITEADFFNSYGQISANLERSASLAFNGSTVNANRPLILIGQGLTDANADIYLFLYYLRLCLCFSSSNVSVKVFRAMHVLGPKYGDRCEFHRGLQRP
jgi:hypothetical protein